MCVRRERRQLGVAASVAIGGAVWLSACATAQHEAAPLPAVTPIMIPPAIPAGAAAELGGSVFAWQETELAGGARVTPAAPERYTLEFGSDGRVRLRADCNRGSAAFEAGAGRTLTLSAIGTTKMGCPPGSQDAEYLRELAQVDGYRPVDNGLVLTLRGSAGAMRFATLPR